MSYDHMNANKERSIIVRGASLEELFTESLLAVLAAMQPRVFKNNDAEADHELRLEGEDAKNLLEHFLNAALHLALEHDELYEEVRFARLTSTELEAKLYGRLVEQYDLEAHEVICRELTEQDGDWQAEIILL